MIAAGSVEAPSESSPPSDPRPGGHLLDEVLLEREQPLRAAVEPLAGPPSARHAAPSGRAAACRAVSRAHAPGERRARHAQALRRLREAPALDDGRTQQADACP